MKFDEVDDPHKLGRDVADIGSWGNGDVEIVLEKESQIAALLDIISQSYDKQLEV